MFDFKGRMRSLLRHAGKGDKKVASVFGVSAAASHRAVLHLREGAPGVPIWLFTTAAPLPETEALCERVYRHRNALALVAGAQSHLWQRWTAISVATWTGKTTGARGAWALKLAPFLIPPFRVLILNGDGGFFGATPSNIFVHCERAGWDAVQSGWASTREAIHSAREALHNARVHAGEAIRRARVQGREAIRRTDVRGRGLYHGLCRLSGATGLRVLATVMRWTFHPHVRLFKRLHGDQPLMLDMVASEGESVVHFTQRGPQWDGEALEELARSSDARWLLWQNGGEVDIVPDGASLFGDARTFAVSRQTHFRGWKMMLAATAPFRTLQAGEASRVLAPLSGTILVDRKKLLALGIPRCSMPGTAWLMLFWKAAAAGWRSYSMGRRSAEHLTEQPEFPIQDTAFVLQAACDRTLRSLYPRQQDLARGNISFAPAFERMARRDTGRLKVLVVSPFLPFPLSHGGAVRMFNLCRELSDRVDFTLIAMREAKDQVDYGTLHEVFREVHIVDKDERASNDKRLPAQVSASESTSLRALISQLSQKLLPDLMQIEYTHFAGFRECAPGVPAILVEHDLTFSLYRQLAETNPSAALRREYKRWLSFERKWLGAYEGVWTVSEEDRVRAMEEGERAADRTFAIPNGVDIERFQPSDAAAETPEIFYVGSFRHLPNIIGFEKLCQEIMPRVWAKAPNTRLSMVAGPEHEWFWKKFGRKDDLRTLDPRIEVHGFVEDLRPLYARASVVAVPLEVSAGTNIKVLEAMACGKAIVSTPVGCAGLDLRDGYDIAIRKEWGDFADAVCELLEGAALRSGLGGRARRTVEHDFSWTAIAERAYESYVTVAGQPAHSKQHRDRRLSVA
jgi:glycosyltransferase involved in cell wall biosynthesis